MKKSLNNVLKGYQSFRKKYALGNRSIMRQLASDGQNPEVMVIACCDSRVDPALIFQCHPGDLFVVRNVANIVPPYEKDEAHHGTSAALEFGICFLKVKNLILLGHSQCGGIHALLKEGTLLQDDFISNWVSLIDIPQCNIQHADECAQLALKQSHKNCMTFPWLQQKVQQGDLQIHLWFFDIKTGQIFAHQAEEDVYKPLV